MSPTLQSSLSVLGLKASYQHLGHCGWVLSGRVGYRQAAAAVRLLRALGWSRFMGVWGPWPAPLPGYVQGLPSCGVVVVHV